MDGKTYGVLLLSFSRHSHQRNFVPLFQKHPRLHLVAVADEPDIEPELRALNQRWARDLDIPYIEGVESALALDEVDIVSIGHEIERRAGLILRAARAGKHLWIDKFPGATIDQADRVVQGVEAEGVRAIVPSYTYGELAGQSRRLLASGALGEFMGVHVDVLFAKGWPRPIAQGQRAPHFLPPGRWKFPDIKRELLTVGAYAVGLVQTCMGPVRQVLGQAGAHFFPEHAEKGAEDFGTLTLCDERGCIATLCGGRVGVATHPHGGPSRAWLVGSRGTGSIDAKRPTLDVFRRDDMVSADYSPPAEDPMQWAGSPPTLGRPLAADPAGLWNGLLDLVAALDADRDPAYSVRQVRELMEILLAGYLSVLRGGPVDLPLEREVP